MTFVPWSEFWRQYFERGDHERSCSRPSPHDLDEIAKALEEYIDSARAVAAGAAKNVEDAEALMGALQAVIERKKAALEGAPSDSGG